LPGELVAPLSGLLSNVEGTGQVLHRGQKRVCTLFPLWVKATVYLGNNDIARSKTFAVRASDALRSGKTIERG
jgi:hypothetical protein